ncbi:hypothetical protein BCR36DRAFT_586802 [Piromyces finnis]|uniref:GPN-loop GTPase 3 n=1 Tax=Piromyces finnis TaxID=1754191 RepID=A0A1Y1UXR8_9FUNG|nr:hypothetical protein BCR36DRAFT_586802 [Piromyces finnis]|eukprot:ORX43122.1 hypothetical protein BCR36DRAFT_586802 [Piromyces finnis]
MGKQCQLVIGPAGSGKSTYCRTIMSHCQSIKRSVHLVNLDPAAENFEYEPTIDIRDLITLDDVMEELDYGPNGGLVYCMEFLINNINWLEEELNNYEDDYLIFDCPGQIELYTHFPIMKTIVQTLQKYDYNVCCVYLLDSQFIEDTSKFFSGVLNAMSAMIQLEIPHINVLTKVDLLDKKVQRSRDFERYLEVDSSLLTEDINNRMRPRYQHLNEAIVQLIDEYNMVNFLPLDISDEESVAYVLAQVDNSIQYGEDLEVKEREDFTEDVDDDYDY